MPQRHSFAQVGRDDQEREEPDEESEEKHQRQSRESIPDQGHSSEIREHAHQNNQKLNPTRTSRRRHKLERVFFGHKDTRRSEPWALPHELIVRGTSGGQIIDGTNDVPSSFKTSSALCFCFSASS